MERMLTLKDHGPSTKASIVAPLCGAGSHVADLLLAAGRVGDDLHTSHGTDGAAMDVALEH